MPFNELNSNAVEIDEDQDIRVSTVIAFIEQTNLPRKDVSEVVFQRVVRTSEKALSTPQSARFVRLLNIYQAVLTLFEDADCASDFMVRPCSAAGGIKPIECALTDEKAQTIIQIVGRIEHGIPV